MLEKQEMRTTSCMKQKPDTVFCMSDEILTGAMKAIQECRFKNSG